MGCASSRTSAYDVDNFIKKIRPLDLIVFRGGDLVSDVIMGIQKIHAGCGEVSHVEVAITKEWCSQIKAPVEPTEMLSWGSTLSGPLNDNLYDAESGGVVFGVQVRNLAEIVRRYAENPRANVGVCRLLDNPIELHPGESIEDYLKRVAILKQKLNSAYDKFNGRTYDANVFSLLGSMFSFVRPLRKISEKISREDWLFCSEFAAALYIHIGVINDETDGKKDGKTLDEKNVVPVDFLGHDQDGIKNPICDVVQIWLKSDV